MPVMSIALGVVGKTLECLIISEDDWMAEILRGKSRERSLRERES